MLTSFYRPFKQLFEGLHLVLQMFASIALALVSFVFSAYTLHGILNGKIPKKDTAPPGVWFLFSLGVGCLSVRNFLLMKNRVNFLEKNFKTDNVISACLAENPIVKAHSREQVDQVFSQKHTAPLSSCSRGFLNGLCCLGGREQAIYKEKSVLPVHEIGGNRRRRLTQRHKD